MKRRNLFGPLLLSLGLYAGAACAQTAIKSVDAEGNVTYSDKPASGAVHTREIPLEPPPSPGAVEEAHRRIREIEQAVETNAAERRKREHEQRARDQATASRNRPPQTVIMQPSVEMEQARRRWRTGPPVQLPAQPPAGSPGIQPIPVPY